MRKFTKEITALMASVAVSAAVGTANISSEEIVETAGVAVQPTTEIVATAGVPLPSDEYTEPTLATVTSITIITSTAGVAIPPDDYTDPTIPPVDGGVMPPDDYTDPTEEFPPTAGVPLPPDDYTDPTEETTEPIPPLAGEPTLPDEYIETTEEFPPLAGDVMLVDGDIDGSGSFNVADVVLISKYLLNKSESAPDNLYAADLNADGKINVFDLVAMKRKILEQITPEIMEYNYDFTEIKNYDNTADYKDGGQISVYTQGNEAVVMWKIPVFYSTDCCVQQIESIDSCTYKTNDTDLINIAESNNVYYYGDSPQGYTYCVIKALKEGNATLTFDCKYTDKSIEFTIDKDLNISVAE